MRDCVKNKQALYYAEYIKDTELLDDDGDATGQVVRLYSKATLVHYNIISGRQVISSPSSSILKQFGTFEEHIKVIITSEDTNVKPDDLFWFKENAKEIYIVSKVYSSLNNTVIGLDLLIGETPYFQEEEDEQEIP